jgi:hypothetical protein
MSSIKRKSWLILLALAVVAFALGTVFVVQGITKSAWISDTMRAEKVTLGLSQDKIVKGNVVDSAAEAQQASAILREDRQKIAPTYTDLLAGGHFNASDPVQLTYAQSINMENSLNLVVLGFGVAQMALGAGVFMLVIAIALGIISLILRQKSMSLKS